MSEEVLKSRQFVSRESFLKAVNNGIKQGKTNEEVRVELGMKVTGFAARMTQERKKLAEKYGKEYAELFKLKHSGRTVESAQEPEELNDLLETLKGKIAS